MLALHKAVLAAERRNVERVHGCLSGAEFLQIVSDPLRFLECCAMSVGASAALLCSEELAFQLPPGGEGIAWELEVTAEMDGLDYKAEFEVPVLRRSASAWVEAGSR